MNSGAKETVSDTFDHIVLPHLPAAHRLARWLMKNEHDAEDAVQDASLRAFRYFGTFTGGNGRAWFLRIVRNTCYGRHNRQTPEAADPFDEELHTGSQGLPDPEAQLLRTAGTARIERAIAALPSRSRELFVLRELEGLSYQELAEVFNIPAGTVMSALWRARRALRAALESQPSGINRRPQKFHQHKENLDEARTFDRFCRSTRTARGRLGHVTEEPRRCEEQRAPGAHGLRASR
jgi:RNA polymerase sigma-70 factor (ECF subfamily)